MQDDKFFVLRKMKNRHGREGTAMAVLMEGQRPGEGDRSLPGLVRRGTGRLPDCGVINRRYT
ncbi:hypothetical protein JL39_14720 [Rhizobium sp. YS-1r]|nr:hypothetical protein JL39_14720 [Rhizobium sp. YS-1r]